jgi:hypothetical protein
MTQPAESPKPSFRPSVWTILLGLLLVVIVAHYMGCPVFEKQEQLHWMDRKGERSEPVQTE